MESNTPRTDSYRDSVSATEISKHPLREFTGLLDFARTLERENAELRAALRMGVDMLNMHNGHGTPSVDRVSAYIFDGTARALLK